MNEMLKNETKERVSWCNNDIVKLTRSQFLEGPKCESQTKNNKKARNRGMFLGSQHLKGVEGRVGAPGWD
jgi:hypothetical protein